MSVPVTVLRYIAALAGTPVGLAAVAAVGGPGAAMLAKFGAAGITAALDEYTASEITEDQMAERLAAKGLRVVAYDPSKLWGVA